VGAGFLGASGGAGVVERWGGNVVGGGGGGGGGGGEGGAAVNCYADSCVILTHAFLNIRQTQHLSKP